MAWPKLAWGAETQISPAATAPASPLVSASPQLFETATELGGSSVDFTWLFLKTIFAMVVVIALAVIVLRFIVPKLSLHRIKATRSDIEIMERIPLDHKKALFVLRVEGRRLLISATEHYVGLITELERDRERETG